MGVPFLFGHWLRSEKYRDVLTSIMAANVSSLSIDMNSLIHLACSIIFMYGDYEDENGMMMMINTLASTSLSREPQEVYLHVMSQLYEGVFRVLVDMIEQIVAQIKPRDTLMLKVDGVVPIAKINQSRGRRYENGLSNMKKGEQPLFDRTAITPGTDFMEFIDTRLSAYLSEKTNYLKLGVWRVIYSPHTVDGEGEHKIFDYFRNGEMDIADNPNGAHVIYGMDADLIILSLLSEKRNIILAKDSVRIEVINMMGQRVDGQKKPKSNRPPRRDDPKNVQIDMLRQAIITEMGNGNLSITDFAVLVTLVGNDFLPHPPTTTDLKYTIETLMEVYTMYMKGTPFTSYASHQDVRSDPRMASAPLGTGDKVYFIDWDRFTTFMIAVCNREPQLLTASFKMKTDNPSRMIQAVVDPRTGVPNYTQFIDVWYDNAYRTRSPEVSDYIGYPQARNMSITQETVTDMCLQYMVGINWVLSYYTRGSDAVTWKWYYPYHHSPLLYHMAIFLESNRGQLRNLFFLTVPQSNERRFTYLHQMLAVIPPTSMNLAKPSIHHLYGHLSPIMDMMPTEFIIEKDGAKVDWAAISILPFPDYDRILKCLPESILPPPGKVMDIAPPRELFERTRSLNYTKEKRRQQGTFRGRRGQSQYQSR
jgi:5'-3' exonuclease